MHTNLACFYPGPPPPMFADGGVPPPPSEVRQKMDPLSLSLIELKIRVNPFMVGAMIIAPSLFSPHASLNFPNAFIFPLPR